MAISISGVSSGRIDKGDTKTLSVTPLDAAGAALTPSTLTAVFTPPSGSANATTKNIGDFTEASGVYSVGFTFDEDGRWHIKVTAVGPSGDSEVEDGYVRVQDIP